jgi:hypothetical protein
MILTFALSACHNMSEFVQDKQAGFNGSFEFTKFGVPANWYIYSPSTIPAGDYDLLIDTEAKIDGSQSLKFDVRQCSSDGGWHSPGIFKTIPARTGSRFKVSFWLKNNGCEFNVSIGSERPGSNGRHERHKLHSSDSIEAWQQFMYDYTVPEGFENIRFELNILQPGVFWIDDVRIEEIR